VKEEGRRKKEEGREKRLDIKKEEGRSKEEGKRKRAGFNRIIYDSSFLASSQNIYWSSKMLQLCQLDRNRNYR
jgi:hypothetical protein